MVRDFAGWYDGSRMNAGQPPNPEKTRAIAADIHSKVRSIFPPGARRYASITATPSVRAARASAASKVASSAVCSRASAR